MISSGRIATGRVKNWREGNMKKRWIAAGMLEAERSFRSVKALAAMPALLTGIGMATNSRHSRQVRSGRPNTTGSLSVVHPVRRTGLLCGDAVTATVVHPLKYAPGVRP